MLVDDCRIWSRNIFDKIDLHIGITKAFSVEITLYDGLGAIYYILRDLVSYHKIKPLFKILSLAFLHTFVSYGRNARLCTQSDLKPRLISDCFRHFHLSLGKKALTHKTLYSRCNVISRNINDISYFKSRITYDYIVFITVISGNLNISNFIAARHRRENDWRVIDSVIIHLLC